MKCSQSRKDLREIAKVRVPRDYPWKCLDALVEDLGCDLGEMYEEVKSVARSRDIDAYLRLSEVWGSQGKDLIGVAPNIFFAQYQASSLLKKFRFPSGSKERKAAALKKFLAAEESCKEFNENGFRALAFLEDEEELAVFTYARTFLQKLLGQELPSRAQLTHWSRHGPGANLDTQRRSTSLYDKYSNWPYSCTEQALTAARLSIMDDQRWHGALEDSYRRRFNIPMTAILDQERFWANVFKVVPGNRITFVPKNSQTDRSIAIEPCMNLFLQLGVDGFIRRRLMRWGVNLDDQTKNQAMARIGSRNWEDQDSFVTLDLAAASDTISVELCRLLLPSQWFSYLMTIRSPEGVCGGETILYNKISSMGNGFTFALESAIFTSLVYGVERATRGSFSREKVAVYGDDIIVRKLSAPLVIRMLNRFGFSINLEKSFVEGPFRESCGADWFRGTPVRPVFMQSNPATVMELWSDLNRLRRILSLRRMGFEFKVTSLIERWIPPAMKDVAGPLSDQDFDSYRHVPLPTVRYRHGLWTFKRLVVIPKSLKGDSFLFRKLMHPLREHATEPYSVSLWGGCKVTGAGSRFTITRSNAVTVRYSSSPASHWQDEYTEQAA